MNLLEAAIVVLFLLLGPVVFAPLERNLECHFFALGMISVTLAGLWEWDLVRRTLLTPLPITVAVVIAGAIFGRVRRWLDRRFEKIRGRVSRGPLTASAVPVISLASSGVTAIIAALMLVEAVGLLRLGPAARTRVVVAGCFAIGLGSALTPIGGPLTTLASSAMNLDFLGLFRLLAPWALPAIVVSSFFAGYYARGPYDLIAEGIRRYGKNERRDDPRDRDLRFHWGTSLDQ